MSGELPQRWATAPLDSLCERLRGVSYQRDDASSAPKPGHVLIVRANNIESDALRFEDLVWIPKGRVSEKQMIRKGDVVIAMSSGSKSVVGKTAQALDDWEGAFGAFCGVLRSSQELNSRYFGLFLRTRYYRHSISELAAGTNINNLKAEDFTEIEVPLSPLGEQRRIVAKLTEGLGKVDACQQRLAKIPVLLKRFRQSVLAAAFSGRLTADWREENRQDNEPLTRRLSELGKITGGVTKNAKRQGLNLQVPYLRVANVCENRLELGEVLEIGVIEQEFERTRLMKNDLLFVEGNGSMDQIGRAALRDGSIRRSVRQNHLIKFRAGEIVVPSYVLFQMMSPGGRTQLVEKFTSSAGLNTLSISKSSDVELPVPPLAEQ